jgi:hypothetical protein
MIWIRVALINFLLLVIILISVEASYRVFKTVSSCIEGSCDFEYLKNPNSSKPIGMAEFNSKIGYVPRKMFKSTISDKRWNGAFVSINKKGFRDNANINIEFKDLEAILVAGDSFTFGDQVGNAETWPSCLERGLLKRVDNAGVFGYSVHQALLRIKEELESLDSNYSKVILSILVGVDFDRDAYRFKSGFPKSAVILDNNIIKSSEVPDIHTFGSKFDYKNRVIYGISNYFRIVKYFSNKIEFYKLVSLGKNEIHPNHIDKNTGIKWILKQYSNIPNDKILLLQYNKNSNSEKVLTERAYIKKIANQMNIKLIDTFEAVQSSDYNKNELYFGQHTPLGNSIVCNEILKFF